MLSGQTQATDSKFTLRCLYHTHHAQGLNLCLGAQQAQLTEWVVWARSLETLFWLANFCLCDTNSSERKRAHARVQNKYLIRGPVFRRCFRCCAATADVGVFCGGWRRRRWALWKIRQIEWGERGRSDFPLVRKSYMHMRAWVVERERDRWSLDEFATKNVMLGVFCVFATEREKWHLENARGRLERVEVVVSGKLPE